MRIVRSVLLSTLLLVPAQIGFAQGTSKSPPAAKAPPVPSSSAAAVATAAPPAGPSSAPSHEIMTEVDAAMGEKAVSLFKEGNAAFRDGKYAQAQAAYKAAWALDLRSQRVVRNLGSTELELRMYRDAAEHLTIALRLADASDPKRASIEKDVAEARAKVGAIVMSVKGAGQPLDGVEIVQIETGRSYQTPLVDPIFVDAGKSSFRIRREGYESQEKVFDLKPGEQVTPEVELARAPGFDGKTGPTSPTSTTTAPVPGARSKMPGLIVGGVGVAAAIVGGALVGVASAVPDDIRSKQPNPPCRRAPQADEDAVCADLRSQANSGSAMSNAGVGMLVGGGVLVAAGVLWLLIPSKKASDAKASHVVPVVGRDGGGLVLSGSF